MEQAPTPPETDISAEFPYKLRHVKVLDAEMAYVDTGPMDSTATTTIFLHGNPTSSYIWRNIMPHVSSKARCIAPDLVGMGHSTKLDIEYRFVEHVRSLDAFISLIVPAGKVVLVIQDWGSALGFHWAFRHQDRVAGIAFMEFMRTFPTWDDAAQGKAKETFRAFRNPQQGRKLIIEQNSFIDVMLARAMVRQLTPEEHKYYADPYINLPSREPLYRWPNEIPIEGEPEDVWKIVSKYQDWLLESNVAKLFFWASPGRLVSVEKAKWYLDTLKNVKGVYLGQGVHFLQEDHPHRIGSEIAEWMEQSSL